MRMKILKETREDEDKKQKLQMEECRGKQNSIAEKEVIINVQEVQLDQLNYECNNNNKKIDSLKNIIPH